MTVATLMSIRAQAQDVALDMRACPSPRASDVRAVLAVELHEQLLSEGAAPPSGAHVVEVRCTSDAAELQLRGTETRRSLALSSVPPALRARVLALSIAELVRPRVAGMPPAGPRGDANAETRAADSNAQGRAPIATRSVANPDAQAHADGDPLRVATTAQRDAHGETRRTADPNAQVASGDTSAAASERGAPNAAADDAENAGSDDEDFSTEASSASESRPAPTHFAWLGAEAQATPLFGVGGSLFFQANIGPWIAWSSALSLSHASTTIDRGELNAFAISLRTGIAFALRSRSGSLHAGAGIRGQWQRLDGAPSDDATAAADFSVSSLGPAVFAGASWQFAPPLFLGLELEADRLREVRARVEGGDTKTLSPWRGSAAIGAGLSW